ncbi:MAG: hypothetical protein WCR72_13180 [Bacteroidota bacterium]
MILRLLLVMIPVLMAVVPTMAQVTVYAGQTSLLSVAEVPGDTYTWELYNNVNGVNFSLTPGNCPVTEALFTGGINTGAAVHVTWITPGTYFYKVTARRQNCTMNLKVGKMTVLEALPTAELAPLTPICVQDSATISITLTGSAPWSIDVSNGLTTTTYDNVLSNPFSFAVAPLTTTNYTVTRVSDAYGQNLNPSNTVTLVVKPRAVTSPIIQYGP